MSWLHITFQKLVTLICFTNIGFFSIDGIIARIVVPKGQNITGKYYANHVLPKVFENELVTHYISKIDENYDNRYFNHN
ncbi:14841_t:CDS:2 [Entrophospora sp. SA101]|nr:14841_t:CDS:2 [Entrophospora sp. SA101]